MIDKQSMLFEAYRDASQRFDYFIIALAAAFFAYVGQSWRPTPLTLSSGTFELAAVLLFAASVAAGLLHRQYVVTSLKLNHGILEAEEQHAQLLSGSLGQGMVHLATGEVLSPVQASELMVTVAKTPTGVAKNLGQAIFPCFIGIHRSQLGSRSRFHCSCCLESAGSLFSRSILDRQMVA